MIMVGYFYIVKYKLGSRDSSTLGMPPPFGPHSTLHYGLKGDNKLIQKLSGRFDQLYQEIPAIESTIRRQHGDMGDYDVMDDELALTWKVKAKNLLVSACGKESQHYQEFVKAENIETFESTSDPFKRMKSVFIAARDDYKGGYLTSIKNLIQADVFDSEFEQAVELLSSGYKLAAAVMHKKNMGSRSAYLSILQRLDENNQLHLRTESGKKDPEPFWSVRRAQAQAGKGTATSCNCKDNNRAI